MITRRDFLKLSLAGGAGLVLSQGLGGPRSALAQDDLDQYIGAPATVVAFSYDPLSQAIAGCTELPVGLYKASQLGQAGFGVRVEFSYTSAGQPVNVTATTALAELSKVTIDQGTVEVAICTEAPPPDDLAAVKAEAIIVKMG